MIDHPKALVSRESRCVKTMAGFAALVLLVACSGVPNQLVEADDKVIELVYLNSEHGNARLWPSAEYVARTEEEWERAWDEGKAMDPRDAGIPRDGRPVVDFERYMVIGISRGYGFSGCHGLYFRAIVARANFIEAQFIHHEPKETAQMCTAMGQFLTRWVLVPKSSKPVRFVG